MIRAITDRRPTYGYRRVHQLLNIELKNTLKARVNHKRVGRMMKLNKLLLTRYSGKLTLNHYGKMIKLRPQRADLQSATPN